MLLVGGFIRSMFFTGVNALSYAEVSAEDTSKATPITAVFQQLSIALGVALAGGILEVSTSIHGGPLTLSDFHIAFFIVAAVSAAASLSFMRLAPDAGNAVSGNGRLTTPKTLEPGQPPRRGMRCTVTGHSATSSGIRRFNAADRCPQCSASADRSRPLKSFANKYSSTDSSREAGGLTWWTERKFCLSLASSSFSAPPWNVLARK